MNKKALRRHFLEQRQSLSVSQWQEKSQKLCQQLIETALFKSSQTVLSYFSVRQEPNLNSLLSFNKNWGFSRCLEQALIWHHWQLDQPLQMGAYGILEPTSDAPLVIPQTVDLILIPAIACDRRGYRLGYGGGYYDRLFAESPWHQIPKIGIIFESAYIEKIPSDPWDIPLSSVCTEQDFYPIQ